MVTAPSKNHLDLTLNKIWGGMNFANDNTDGGFFKLRQVTDKIDIKRASYYKMINGQKIESGWMSEIRGIVADDDSKIRGARVDLIILEEAGSNPNARRSFIKADALVAIGGNRFGIKIIGGTGGDKNPKALEGLREIYYNPKAYNVLPFLHNYTETEDWVETGFFIPYYAARYNKRYLDSRGVCKLKKSKEDAKKERDLLESSPQALLEHKAEFCWTAEEAFAAEGVNKFNKVKIADLIVRLRILKDKPLIKRGYMQFTYKGPGRSRLDISGVKFIPKPDGPIYILLEPLWELNNNDIEPDETMESYRERKSLEKDFEITSKINNLYVAGIDGIDIGLSETSANTKTPSKFCTVIKRRVYGLKEPTYVAFYLDRPDDIREAFKLTIGLLMWYNCQANLEATRMSILTYARDNKFMNYFMKRPRVCYGDITTRKRSNNQYGTTATGVMIDHQTDLIRDYVEDYCHNIWFIEFLEQLNRYTDENKGKFDIIAAMAMAEIGDEELRDVIPKKVAKDEPLLENIGYYRDDKGYVHYGIIPSSNRLQYLPKFKWDLGTKVNINSNPEYE